MPYLMPLTVRTIGLAFALLLASCTGSGTPELLQPYAAEAQQWEPDIQQLEALDESETYPDSSLLFIGSSSIRLWETMDRDLAPYPVIRRGYGGAKLSDVAWYAERLIYPHQFQALVFFIGGNDIWGTPEDKSPAEFRRLTQYLIDTVREKYPEKPIFFIEVTPIPSRWHLQPQVEAGNRAIEAVCEAEPDVHFIETQKAFIGPDGKPRGELFGDDNLHLNEEGYEVWAGLIKSELDRVLA